MGEPTIPASGAEAPAKAAPAPWRAGTERIKNSNPDGAPGKAMELVLVEDNPGDAILISEILDGLSTPVNLHLALDGEQALAILADPFFEPDLMILDLNLPKVSGYEVLEKRPLRNVPVVVFTGSANQADARRSLELGAQEYVRKPSDLQSYEEAIRNVIEKWAHTDAAGA